MNSRERTINLAIGGMSCAACELRIEKALSRINGVVSAKASFARADVTVIIDEARVKPEQLTAAIEQAGYQVLPGQGAGAADSKSDRLTINQLLGIGIVLFAVYWIIRSTVGFNFIPQVDQSMGYGLLFVVGLLTSLHCIAMCGGINISQCVSQAPAGDAQAPQFAKFKPSLLYNGGRVLSYTIVGGLAGALGSAVSFSGPAKGIVAIVSGLLMVVIGINMLNLFPGLRRFNISLPKFLGKKISDGGTHGPFLVGLLNGLMPCGPLQTIQLYALGTGSFLAGAASMFFFSLGTVPLMFGFGLLSSFLSGKFTHRMLKVSAILVIILGVMMMGRGLSLSGVSVAAPGSGGSIATIEGNLQTVTTVIESGRYAPIVVQQGIPVRWIIKAKADDLNGCNNPIIVPKYKLEKRLVPGDNVIEFTPDASGTIAYSCWMGMITSYIKVVPDLTQASVADLQSGGGAAGSFGGGACCSDGSKATKFFNGNIPTDQIVLAQIAGGVQNATIIVNDEGYAPAVVVLQRGTKAKIKFNPEKLNGCNYVVQFPEYGGQLDLSAGQLETPELEITQNFTFRCWMGMINGYVKVVDDLNRVDLNAIRNEVKAYRPVNQGGGGCCGVGR